MSDARTLFWHMRFVRSVRCALACPIRALRTCGLIGCYCEPRAVQAAESKVHKIVTRVVWSLIMIGVFLSIVYFGEHLGVCTFIVILQVQSCWFPGGHRFSRGMHRKGWVAIEYGPCLDLSRTADPRVPRARVGAVQGGEREGDTMVPDAAVGVVLCRHVLLVRPTRPCRTYALSSPEEPSEPVQYQLSSRFVPASTLGVPHSSGLGPGKRATLAPWRAASHSATFRRGLL